jgi:hypothetical protein
VGLERGPLSLVSTTEELLGRTSNGSGLENQEYGRWDPSRWPRGTICTQKFVLTSLTSGSLSVGIVSSRTQVTEFSSFLIWSFYTSPPLPLSRFIISYHILKLVVCILLRVLGQVQGFHLTQHWFEYFIQ